MGSFTHALNQLVIRCKLTVLCGAILFMTLGAAQPALAATFTAVSSFTPTGGPIAAGAAGSNFDAAGQAQGNPWIDQGGYWSVTSGNQAVEAHPPTGAVWNIGLLMRPAVESTVDFKVSETLKYSSTSNVPAAGNGNVSSSNMSGYACAVGSSTTVSVDTFKSGTVATAITSPAFTALTVGSTYVLQCVGIYSSANATETITATLYQSDGATVIGSVAYASTASSDPTLYDVAGVDFAYTYASTTPTQGATNLATYTDVPAATSYTLTAPSPASGYAGVASPNFTVTANGTLASAVTITPSDGGAGGSFGCVSSCVSGAVTLAANAYGQSSAKFTYTPPNVTQTDTVSTTNSSGGSLTDPSAVSYAATAVQSIAANSPMCVTSPFNWKGGGTDTGMVATRGGTTRSSWNVGAYISCTWTAGASNPAASIVFGSFSTNARVAYNLNGTITSGVTPSGTVTLSGLTAGAVENLDIYITCSAACNNTAGATWGSTVNSVQFQGMQIDTASTAGTEVVPTKNILEWGDSIECGFRSDGATTDNYLHGHAYAVMQQLRAQGYGVGESCSSGNGYIHLGNVNGDVPGLYAVTGSSGGIGGTLGTSRWNMIDSGVSMLDSIGHLSAYGLVGQEPYAIVISMGGNEANYALSTSDTQASASQFLPSLRSAVLASTKIIDEVEIPLEALTWTGYHSGAYLTAVVNGMQAYKTAHASDINTSIVDFGTGLANQIYISSNSNTNDGTHPDIAGHGLETRFYEGAIASAFIPVAASGLQHPGFFH